MTIKLGSLFDGSGGFPLAGAMCGIEPVWAAEVEPYPIAVTSERFDGSEDSPLKKLLEHHHPNMKLYMRHLGNICEINGAEIEPVDIITFGSPCQDLSVAGLRKGLKHEANGDEETTRSGLFMEAVRIIKEMRAATNGKYPRFALWENVPGAFSSNKGEDFRIVCEELIKIVEPAASMPSVPKVGTTAVWAYADSYIGDGWSLAYRVFDAQYWGVPQRRRRIHLVVDFRGTSAREVLFERKGLRGYFAESGTPWQETAPDAEGGTLADDREGGSTGGRGEGEAGNRGVRGRLDAVTYAVDQGGGKSSCSVQEDLSPTLACTHGGAPAIAYTMVVRSGCDADSNGRSAGKGALIQTERASTINTVQDQYLFQPTAYDARGNGDGGVVATLTGDHQNRVTDYTSIVCEPVACGTFQETGPGWWNDSEIGATLRAMSGGDAMKANLVAYGIDQGATRDVGKLFLEERSKTLANGTCPGHHNGVVIADPARGRYIVRRLTPTECARLQGFADWWGHLEPKHSLTDDEHRFWMDVRNTHAAINGKAVKDYNKTQMLTWYNKLHTDGAEYKMWGNGIALPPALYCMQGITDVLNREEDDSWLL